MTNEHDLARPRATPAQRTRAPSFAAPKHTRATYPLDQLAPDLEEPWIKEDTDTPDRTTIYTHPEDHRIGLRLQPGDLIIQTWITAGPDLPPIPAGTAEEKAEAQATNDARLQPGRSWHATVAMRGLTFSGQASAVDFTRRFATSDVRRELRVGVGNPPPSEGVCDYTRTRCSG
jgi:hypothetical protein